MKRVFRFILSLLEAMFHLVWGIIEAFGPVLITMAVVVVMGLVFGMFINGNVGLDEMNQLNWIMAALIAGGVIWEVLRRVLWRTPSE